MKCKQRFINIFAAVVLAGVAVNFSMTGMDEAAAHSAIQHNTFSCFSNNATAAPSGILRISEITQTASESLAYLFQILFILFIISPPIIALMLFLIWKELKARNKMK